MARLLPRGWRDLLAQVVLFCGAYWLYRLVRGVVVDHPQAALEHARELVRAERALGVYVEPSVAAWAARHAWVSDAASWAYVNTHFVITTVTLAFVYLRRNAAFAFVRDMFMVAMGLALVAYVAFPTAPPRLLPGFPDPVRALTGGESDGVLVNPYAAVPSMHVGFALMLAGTMWRLARRPLARAAWAVYPALVTAVVVVTANHWVADAALGALTAALAFAVASALRRGRLTRSPWRALVPPLRASTRRSSPTG